MENSRTVLHVEDNYENRVLVRRLLISGGYHILEAENASQALEILTSQKPDLILMDINMPDIDGYALTGRLKLHPDTCQIPVIALTANVMKGDRERTLQAGCDEYIEKPIDIDSFLGIIQRFLLR